jgi:hypothetical protein
MSFISNYPPGYAAHLLYRRHYGNTHASPMTQAQNKGATLIAQGGSFCLPTLIG